MRLTRLITSIVGLWLALLAGGIAVAACSNDEESPRPAVVATPTPSASATESFTRPVARGPSLTPSPTFPATHTPEPLALPATVQPTLTPTELPPPYIDIVRQGDTCGAIALRWGLDLAGGSEAIKQANNLNSGCTNLVVGQNVVVPRPTLTATPPGLDATQTAIATSLPRSLLNITPFAIYEYCPEEGDTLQSIALKSNASRQRICELNPLPDGLDCRGCDFVAGGANARCSEPPLISLNNCLNVPGPTFTPTPTATFSGSETPTLLPTYLPPQAVFPADGTLVQGSAQLVWQSVGQLDADEFYVVVLSDLQSGALLSIVQTRQSSYLLPVEWRPAAGQALEIGWTVEVIRRAQAESYVSVSRRSPSYRFIWQG